ncbi:Uncharacterised protein [Klebsiella pneumoniae]|nr:Uncharacterised protein [Klebsiella quasipneumoniae]STR08801.1 Uncharacterised protein [Klebsiella quasipneumoniae]VGD55574.1 Uncharacterised protein [Klebsiella pneumoniae]VGE72031.1 Uncharacterised protein [Klebsiella pneumoniae]VGK34268.1 Uncharacterised protein [Klebsiella pneumoniae]
MVRVIICHQLNTKTNIISGSEVSRLSVAIHLVLSSKSFTGIRFKAPRPPDHSTFRVTNNQAEVATLVVFNGDVLVRRHDDLSLPVGKWTGR